MEEDNDIIDWKQGEIDYLDRATFQIILQTYASTFQTALVNMRNHYEDEDWTAFEHVVHNTKTGVGSVKCLAAFEIAKTFLGVSKFRKENGVTSLEVEEWYSKFLVEGLRANNYLAKICGTQTLTVDDITPPKLTSKYIANKYFPVVVAPSVVGTTGGTDSNQTRPLDKTENKKNEIIVDGPNSGVSQQCGKCGCAIF